MHGDDDDDVGLEIHLEQKQEFGMELVSPSFA